MSGCTSCEQKQREQILEKPTDQRTEDEKRILEEGLHSVVPTIFGFPAYGPLSGYEGTYCEFCHLAGQLGAVATGIVTTLSLVFLGTGQGIALLAGLIVFLSGAILTGYLGRYPFFGAVLGPAIEDLFSSSPTEMRVEPATESTPTPQTDNQPIGQEQDRLQRRIQELQDDLSEIQQQRDRYKQEKEQAEQRLEQIKSEIGVATSTDLSPGSVSHENATLVMIPRPNGVYVPFWVRRWASVSVPEWNLERVPIGTWSPDGNVPDPLMSATIDETNVEDAQEYIPFPPERVAEDVSFLETSNREFDPEEHRALVYGSIGDVDDARTSAITEDEPWATASAQLLIDTDGHCVPIPDDVRGRERREDLRQRKKEAQKNARQAQSQAKRLKDQVDELRHKIGTVETELTEKSEQLEKYRQENQQLQQQLRSLQQEGTIRSVEAEHLQRETRAQREAVQKLGQQKQLEREKRLREGETRELTESKQEIQEEAQKQVQKLLYGKIQMYWDGVPDDTESLTPQEERDLVREFLNQDFDKRTKKQAQQEISQKLGDEL